MTAAGAAPRSDGPTHPVGWRHDLQILRGVAVLVVVFYHYGIPGFRAGYLGVDVFFVISGFLMMRMLASDQDASRLSIPRFYLRRARRLLPAALVTIAATSVLGLFVMARWDWDAYAGQAAGALSFTANIFVWQDGHDYFGAAADTRPLLHFWSLSLEEQFYLVLPFAILLAGRRFRLPLLVLAATASLVACWILAPRDPSAAFYLLPTRAWELLLGAVVAGILIARPRLRVGWPIQAAGALLVLVVPLAPLDDVHPRLDALLVCLGTAAILAGSDRGRLAGLPGRLLGRVGDISYSLYLVHWPVLAFAAIAFYGSVPAGVRLGLLAVSFALAALQYRFVEIPFRRQGDRRPNLRFVAGISAAALAIAAGVAAQVYLRSDGGWRDLRRANHGLGAACDMSEATFTPLPECRTAEHPATALWGDSFMMHWADGLRDLPGGIIQITRSACPPMVGMVVGPAASAQDWIERCFEFHQSAFDYILADPGITTVVLSGNLRTFMSNGVTMLADPAEPPMTSAEAARIAFGRMIGAIEAAGKRVVFIAAMPSSGWDIGSCIERRDTGLISFGRTDCTFTTATSRANDRGIADLLEGIATDTGIPVVWPAAAMCDALVCRPTLDGLPLYRDRAHIPRITTPVLAGRLGLAGIVAGTARCTEDPADAATCAVLSRPEWLTP